MGLLAAISLGVYNVIVGSLFRFNRAARFGWLQRLGWHHLQTATAHDNTANLILEVYLSLLDTETIVKKQRSAGWDYHYRGLT